MAESSKQKAPQSVVFQSNSNKTTSRETAAALRSNTNFRQVENINSRPSQDANNLLLRNSNSGKMLLMQSNQRLAGGGAFTIHETLVAASQLQSQRINHGHSAAVRPKDKSQYGSRVEHMKQAGTIQADQRQVDKFQNLASGGQQRQLSTQMTQQAQAAFIGMRGTADRQRNLAEQNRLHSEAGADTKLSCLIMQHSLHATNNHLHQFLTNGTLSPRFNQHHHPIDSDDDEDDDANISDVIKNLIRKPFAQSIKPPQHKLRSCQANTYAAPSRVKDIYNTTASGKMPNVGRSTLQRTHQNDQAVNQGIQLKQDQRYPQTVIPSKFQNPILQLEHHKGYYPHGSGAAVYADMHRFGRLVGSATAAAAAAEQEATVGGVQPRKFPQIPNSQNQASRPHYHTHKRSVELKELNSRKEESFSRHNVMTASQDPKTPSFTDQHALGGGPKLQHMTQQVSKHRLVESSNQQQTQPQQLTSLPQITSSHDKLITVGDSERTAFSKREFSIASAGRIGRDQVQDGVKTTVATEASNEDLLLKSKLAGHKTQKMSLRNQNANHSSTHKVPDHHRQLIDQRSIVSSIDRKDKQKKVLNLGNVLKQQESIMKTVFEKDSRRQSETRKPKQQSMVTIVDKPHQELFPRQHDHLQSQHEPMRELNEYDSDFEQPPQQTVMKKFEEQLVVANAHAELLNFFAQCEDSNDDELQKKGEDQQFFQHENQKKQQQHHERRKTTDFLRKNKQTNIDINAKRRQGYATNSGQVSSLFERVNSYKLLTQMIGKDEHGNDVGASLDEFRIQRVLGTGAYAVVKLATHEATKKRVALKIYEGNKLDPIKRKGIWQEIQCMKILQSPSFPKLYADFETSIDKFDPTNQLVLVQEYVSGQSLFQLLRAKGQKSGLSEENAKFYFKQIVEAVKSMHGQLICHRDLKLENILVSDRQKVKIIDFGFSIRTDKNLKMFCGTSSYMSPEIIRKTDYNGFKADIWALGVVLYVLSTGRFPFKAKTEKELFVRIQGGTFLPPVQMNYDAKRLITRMLSVEPSKRPTAAEVLHDPWFFNALNNNSKDVHVI